MRLFPCLQIGGSTDILRSSRVINQLIHRIVCRTLILRLFNTFGAIPNLVGGFLSFIIKVIGGT